MLLPLLIAFSMTIGLALIVTPLVIIVAPMIGAMDKPNERKVHQIPTPRLGGVAIFFSFFGGLFTLFLLRPDVLSTSWLFEKEGIVLMTALFFVLCLGIWDDIQSLTSGKKFAVQFVLSVIIHSAGFSVSNVTHIFGAQTAIMGFLDFPLTVLWIVGVTNAINLIDGLDGLAAGVSTIAAITIMTISFLHGDSGVAILALLVAGSLIGFLQFNFNPAKIFLGDSGSLFLGFLLAVLSAKSSEKSSFGFTYLVPMLVLGLPITDTLLSMIRRFIRSFFSDHTRQNNIVMSMKSMFQPDSGHIHHRLINNGLSHRNTVIMLYIVSGIFGISAFTIAFSTSLIAFFMLGVVGGAIIIGIHQLRYAEMSMVQNMRPVSLYKRSPKRIQVLFKEYDDQRLHLLSKTISDRQVAIGSDKCAADQTMIQHNILDWSNNKNGVVRSPVGIAQV
jgi:UDP-GlcNAc:undecaprenyl-phosphate GlcNAc-1-phosphate transferase